MRKWLFVFMITSSLSAMYNSHWQEEDFLYGEGSDYYSRKAEAASNRKRKNEQRNNELYMLARKQEKENRPRKRTRQD